MKNTDKMEELKVEYYKAHELLLKTGDLATRAMVDQDWNWFASKLTEERERIKPIIARAVYRGKSYGVNEYRKNKGTYAAQPVTADSGAIEIIKELHNELDKLNDSNF